MTIGRGVDGEWMSGGESPGDDHDLEIQLRKLQRCQGKNPGDPDKKKLLLLDPLSKDSQLSAFKIVNHGQQPK